MVFELYGTKGGKYAGRPSRVKDVRLFSEAAQGDICIRHGCDGRGSQPCLLLYFSNFAAAFRFTAVDGSKKIVVKCIILSYQSIHHHA